MDEDINIYKKMNVCVEYEDDLLVCVWNYFIVPIYGDLEYSDTVFPDVNPAAKERHCPAYPAVLKVYGIDA